MAETPAEGDNTLQTFLLFPKLPTEIRLKIWHIFLDTPRTISLKYREEPEKTSDVTSAGTKQFVKRLGYFFIEKDDAPAVLLDVNIEAREEALAFYEGRIDKAVRVGRSQWARFPQSPPFDRESVVYIEKREKEVPISWSNTTFLLSTRELPKLPKSLFEKFQHVKFTVLDPGNFRHYTA